uniref:RNA-directed DNA polymerase, eukaryota n=1 Tax=Tanacetum cinerariifolium TaxID=118510 RepID=A0A699H0Y4_TANCI|nr:RNA-directed DNA polymerase, eukaryota [Tanacetum cinerariifolium]
MAHSILASFLRRNLRDGDGVFSVASVRNLIDDKTLAEVGAKTRWIKYVPIKVNILAWRIKLNNLPSRLNLSRRGLDLDTILCPSCNLAVESSNHIIFGCPMVKDLFKFFARWWDVSMTTFFSYDEWWNWFSNLQVPSKLKLIFEGVFYISWWVIWNYRNKVIFGPGHQSKDRLTDVIVAFSFTWCRSRCKAKFSWIDRCGGDKWWWAKSGGGGFGLHPWLGKMMQWIGKKKSVFTSIHVKSGGSVRWSWSLVGTGDFLVSSVRKLIDNAILPKGKGKVKDKSKGKDKNKDEGGRLTLIKAVLGSLGIYYLSIFKAHETILNSMESLSSRFFLGGSQDSRNMVWVKWSQALHSQEGGLNNQGCSFNGTWSRIIGTSNFLHSKANYFDMEYKKRVWHEVAT